MPCPPDAEPLALQAVQGECSCMSAAPTAANSANSAANSAVNSAANSAAPAAVSLATASASGGALSEVDAALESELEAALAADGVQWATSSGQSTLPPSVLLASDCVSDSAAGAVAGVAAAAESPDGWKDV